MCPEPFKNEVMIMAKDNDSHETKYNGFHAIMTDDTYEVNGEDKSGHDVRGHGWTEQEAIDSYYEKGGTGKVNSK